MTLPEWLDPILAFVAAPCTQGAAILTLLAGVVRYSRRLLRALPPNE